MKAAVLEGIGTSPKFRIKELPSPVVKAGQVLVRNFASSVNPVDAILRMGKSLFNILGTSNQIIGNDFCGKVIASKSRLFKEGDEVFGMTPVLHGGTFAEEIAVDESWAVLKPANLSYLQAGVIPLVGLTAYQALFSIGHIRREDTILITGCTGGVGASAVQLAKGLEAHVSGLCRESHRDRAKELGCDVVIDYDRQRIPGEAKYDLIFDAAGKYTYSDMKEHLHEHARFITTRGATQDIKGIFNTAMDMICESKMKMVTVKPSSADLSYLKLQAEESQFRLPMAATFSLKELEQAHQFWANGGFVGKVGISIG